MYKLKDFGNDDYSGDCFALVGKIHGLDCKRAKEFVEIMAIIDRDLHLGLMDGCGVDLPVTPIPIVSETTAAQKSEEGTTLYVGAKGVYGCGTCLLGRKRHHTGYIGTVPGGFTEEVQQ